MKSLKNLPCIRIPNPFNPITTIKYNLKQAEQVTLIIYDILGQKVKVLLDKRQKAGRYKINFDATGLANGMYFYRIKAGKFEKTRKMLIIK